MKICHLQTYFLPVTAILFSEVGGDQTIHDKCHHNNIIGPLNVNIPAINFGFWLNFPQIALMPQIP